MQENHANDARFWPLEVHLAQDKRQLTLHYADGVTRSLQAEYLRVESPSAEVRGHAPGQETLQTGKAGVTIADLEPVGQYAIKLIFDDGHDTGLYSWDYLYELAKHYESMWMDYIARLEAAGYQRQMQ